MKHPHPHRRGEVTSPLPAFSHLSDNLQDAALPPGWVWTTIGEVANTTSGGTPSRKQFQYYGGIIPWVKSGELGDSLIMSSEEYITESGLRHSSAKIFPKGTPLVALYGATVGRTGILQIDAATNQAVCAMFARQGAFTSKYMMYWLQSQRDELVKRSSGGAQPNISQAIIRSISLPLPPLPEQHRIVAAIETQFTRLDAGVAALKRIQAGLRRYKASVLKAACEGRLVPTEAELARHPYGRGEVSSPSSPISRATTGGETGAEMGATTGGETGAEMGATTGGETSAEMGATTGGATGAEMGGETPPLRRDVSASAPYESGGALLRRILAERRRAWESAHPGKHYEAPPGPDTRDLPELPEGWVWATVEQMLGVGTGATPLRSRAKYWNNGTIPWVTSGALNDLLVRDASEYITQVALGETNAKLFPAGTLLIAMYGEGKTRGKVSELIFEATTNQACAALLFDPSTEVLKPFIKLFFQKNYEDIRQLSSGGVQPNLNLGIIKQAGIPLPPQAEQRRIVAEVERRLSVVAEVEAAVAANLRRAARLRQAILRQAFAGKLAPQDPKDEPASLLLARIREEQGRGDPAPTIKRGRPPKSRQLPLL